MRSRLLNVPRVLRTPHRSLSYSGNALYTNFFGGKKVDPKLEIDFIEKSKEVEEKSKLIRDFDRLAYVSLGSVMTGPIAVLYGMEPSVPTGFIGVVLAGTTWLSFRGASLERLKREELGKDLSSLCKQIANFDSASNPTKYLVETHSPDGSVAKREYSLLPDGSCVKKQ